ncbi:hypothetical protein SteCoe_29781 [Stentor coeruleus]|uniref:Uncharacterized protein n=1 Tax=Stentor coeruleus TaxID=5963 RepID=A0A1R2B544_9CILI|nr:hypothetical protein SteCoe_29781 [Stentor coeruleus]
MRGYWNIDDYLVEEESIKITDIQPEILKAFYKSQRNSYKNSVPLWLGKILESRGIGKLILPHYLSENFQKALNYEPQIVNLNKYSEYYYEVTSYFAFTRSGLQLANSTIFVFLCRVKKIFNCLDEGSICKKLAFCEKCVYEKMRKSVVEKQNWKERKYEKVSYKFMSLNPRKKLKFGTKRENL